MPAQLNSSGGTLVGIDKNSSQHAEENQGCFVDVRRLWIRCIRIQL